MRQKYSDEDRAYLSATTREHHSDEPEAERLYNRAWQDKVLADLAARDAAKARGDFYQR